jgi:hypothetical protein
VAAEILASRQEVKMEDEEEEDEKKPFIDIVLEETEVGPWDRVLHTRWFLSWTK